MTMCPQCSLLGAINYAGTSAHLLREALYGDKGQILFATCIHGVRVVEKALTENPTFRATQVRSLEALA